jgi:hypothetical protein
MRWNTPPSFFCFRRFSCTRYATAAANASVKSATPSRLAATWNGRIALRRRGTSPGPTPTKRDASRKVSASGATNAPTTSIRKRERAIT